MDELERFITGERIEDALRRHVTSGLRNPGLLFRGQARFARNFIGLLLDPLSTEEISGSDQKTVVLDENKSSLRAGLFVTEVADR